MIFSLLKTVLVFNIFIVSAYAQASPCQYALTPFSESEIFDAYNKISPSSYKYRYSDEHKTFAVGIMEGVFGGDTEAVSSMLDIPNILIKLWFSSANDDFADKENRIRELMYEFHNTLVERETEIEQIILEYKSILEGKFTLSVQDYPNLKEDIAFLLAERAEGLPLNTSLLDTIPQELYDFVSQYRKIEGIEEDHFLKAQKEIAVQLYIEIGDASEVAIGLGVVSKEDVSDWAYDKVEQDSSDVRDSEVEKLVTEFHQIRIDRDLEIDEIVSKIVSIRSSLDQITDSPRLMRLIIDLVQKTENIAKAERLLGLNESSLNYAIRDYEDRHNVIIIKRNKPQDAPSPSSESSNEEQDQEIEETDSGNSIYLESQRIKAIELGLKLGNMSEASRRLGIRGSGTINRWIYNYAERLRTDPNFKPLDSFSDEEKQNMIQEEVEIGVLEVANKYVTDLLDLYALISKHNGTTNRLITLNTTDEQREKAILKAIELGNIEEAAREVRMISQTLHNWVSNYRKQLHARDDYTPLDSFSDEDKQKIMQEAIEKGVLYVHEKYVTDPMDLHDLIREYNKKQAILKAIELGNVAEAARESQMLPTTLWLWVNDYRKQLHARDDYRPLDSFSNEDKQKIIQESLKTSVKEVAEKYVTDPMDLGRLVRKHRTSIE